MSPLNRKNSVVVPASTWLGVFWWCQALPATTQLKFASPVHSTSAHQNTVKLKGERKTLLQAPRPRCTRTFLKNKKNNMLNLWYHDRPPRTSDIRAASSKVTRIWKRNCLSLGPRDSSRNQQDGSSNSPNSAGFCRKCNQSVSAHNAFSETTLFGNNPQPFNTSRSTLHS